MSSESAVLEEEPMGEPPAARAVAGVAAATKGTAAEKAPAKSKILTRNFVLIFCALMSCSLTLYALLTTITEYATLFGASSVVAGLISGVYVVSSVFARMYAGRKLITEGWGAWAASLGKLEQF